MENSSESAANPRESSASFSAFRERDAAFQLLIQAQRAIFHPGPDPRNLARLLIVATLIINDAAIT